MPGTVRTTDRHGPATHCLPLARWDRLLFDVGQNVPLVGPCLLLLLATLVFRMTDIDLFVSGLFHDVTQGKFPWVDHPLLLAIYFWGLVPSWLLGFGGLAVLAAAAAGSVSAEGKRGATFMVALLVLGPILLVNVVYKDYWGRPRPDDTTHFGGKHPFLRVLDKGPAGDNNSFPSGHAAAGFSVMAPAFLLYRRRPRLAGACLAFGLAFGLVVGLGRVVQGRHFASDVLWAAAVVYYTGCALDYLILAKAPPPARRPAKPPVADWRPAYGTTERQRHAPAAQPADSRREAA